MPERALVLPAQAIELSEVEGKPISWMETARVGKFKSTRYGRFEISLSDLESAEKNINGSPTQIPVDYDHLMLRPQQPGDGKAAGWFQKAERRNNGRELWGLVEWTPRAAEHIRNKEYRYCSPVIVPNFEDNETEENKGTHIVCAAITNVPFIKGMAPIELNGDELVLADVSLSEKSQRIQAAYDAKFNPSGSPDQFGSWITDVFDDHVIARKDGKLWRIDYSIADDLTVTFTSDPVEVVVNYTALSENSPMPEDKKPVTDPKVLELSEQLNQLDGVVKALSANLETEKTARVAAEERNRNLEKQIKTDKARTKVLGLIGEGKLAKKQEEWAISYALSDETGFDTFAATLEKGQAGVKLRTEHGSGEGDEEVETTTTQTAGQKLFALCNDYVEKNGGPEKVRFLDALNAVSKANPQLAHDYRAEQIATAS